MRIPSSSAVELLLTDLEEGEEAESKAASVIGAICKADGVVKADAERDVLILGVAVRLAVEDEADDDVAVVARDVSDEVDDCCVTAGRKSICVPCLSI